MSTQLAYSFTASETDHGVLTVVSFRRSSRILLKILAVRSVNQELVDRSSGIGCSSDHLPHAYLHIYKPFGD